MTTLVAAIICLQNLDAKALERINGFRKIAGVAAVENDAALSKGCKAHADYLVKNEGHASTQGLGAHNEDAKLPGYTEEGAKAGRASDIHFVDPVKAVDDWMASHFHRVPILHPGLKKIGIGYAKGGKWGWVSVTDVMSGREGAPESVVIYPVDKQKDVPVALGNEIPTPIPSDPDRQGGYPITATFAGGSKVTGAKATLKSGKTDVEFWISSPEEPADRRFQGDSICVIAKDVLKGSTTYTVTIEATVDEKPWSKTWSFTTGVAPKK